MLQNENHAYYCICQKQLVAVDLENGENFVILFDTLLKQNLRFRGGADYRSFKAEMREYNIRVGS